MTIKELNEIEAEAKRFLTRVAECKKEVASSLTDRKKGGWWAGTVGTKTGDVCGLRSIGALKRSALDLKCELTRKLSPKR